LTDPVRVTRAMNAVALVAQRRGHVSRVLTDLLSCGWTLEAVPKTRVIPRNALKLTLRTGNNELRLRVFAYKVTGSSRNRPHERRVEITTTYESGLKRLRRFRDVVLGVDVPSGKYVGVDSRRLQIGGPTHNASSFFDLEGLSVKRGDMLINPRVTAHRIFPGGFELHSFFDRTRLSEYLFNQREIHSGSYGFGGLFSGAMTVGAASLPTTIPTDILLGDSFVLASRGKRRKPIMEPKLILAAEKRDFTKLAKRKITPEELKQILNVCDEIGALGEQAVLAAERARLRRLGFRAQASKVERVSLRSVGEGYDILSFEDDGCTRRYLEVKATIGRSPIVDVSSGEWETAKKYGSHYYFVRVTRAKDSPQLFYVRDPVDLEKAGLVSRIPTGWRLDLRTVLRSGKQLK